MRRLIKFLIALCVAPLAASGWSQSPHSERLKPELALDYTWMHSNAPPGGCGCFSLNGGSGTFALPLGGTRWMAVADVSVGHASATVDGIPGSLTLSTFTVGARYSPRWRMSRMQPFAQVLAGLAHGSGSLTQAPFPTAGNAGAAFAGSAGGGLDLDLSARLALRLIDAEYAVTTFDNNGNNLQNNLRLSAGIVLRF